MNLFFSIIVLQKVSATANFTEKTTKTKGQKTKKYIRKKGGIIKQ